MSLGPNAFRIRCMPSERTVVLSGEIDLAAGRELSSAFARFPAGAAEVLVDVSGVTFIDSTGLSKLVEAARRHRVVLRGASPRMRMVMDVTGLGASFSDTDAASDLARSDGASRLTLQGSFRAPRSGGGGAPQILRRIAAHVTLDRTPRAGEPTSPSRRAVTFRCTTDAAYAVLVSEFTDWAAAPLPMRRCSDGFEVTVALESGRSYRYKYLLDGEQWVNDLFADSYVENEFGGYDSVRAV